ncbi:MAG: exodeoxyribonuclease VII large subunit, partial [Rhodospirillaceae bacterium]|nr:exodeoxyribonuclease VII large subunit [Rhodospirillaceae bacterium]
IPRLESIVADKSQALDGLAERLKLAPAKLIDGKRRDLDVLLARLNLDRYVRDLARFAADLDALMERLARGVRRSAADTATSANAMFARLESVSPKQVLNRGYAIVYAGAVPITLAAETTAGQALGIEFADGKIGARVDAVAPPGPTSKAKPRPAGGQGSLF